jgi:shikimate dehydrogenase
MVPLDVQAADLQEAWDLLSNDSRVLGGAIAIPFKQGIASLLVNQLELSASLSSSVNCVFRDSTGLFRGANTDGEAALAVIKENCSEYANAQYLVLGCGGTGSAVISSLVQVLGQRQVTVSIRSPSAMAWLDALGVKNIPFDSFEHCLETTDILINTTSLGFNRASQSPVSLTSLHKLRAESFVFDVVYQPSPTKLTQDALSLRLRATDGKRMNLLQAVGSFQLVNPSLNATLFESLMARQA